jgi:hypothetical protein
VSDEYYQGNDEYDFSESELNVSDNLETQELIDTFKKLGKYTSSKLASGFSDNEHRAGFEGLIGRLGEFYPIPILEMAVKYYRAKQKIVANKLMEAMFEEGASKVVFDNGDTWTKDYDLNITINDKTAFYGWLEAHNYSHIIKTNFVFDKSVERERINAVTQWLLNEQIPFDKDESIHHMTLKSNMRKLYETGEYKEAVDEGVISVTPVQVLKLKTKK